MFSTFRAVSSIGGVFVVAALALALLAITYSLASISSASIDVINRLRVEEAKAADDVEWRVEGGTVYVRLRGLSDSAYVILWRGPDLPNVVEVNAESGWTPLPWSLEESSDMLVVTSSGALIRLDPEPSQSNSTALTPGVLASEGYEYKSLGYYDPDYWLLTSKLTVEGGGYSREVRSRLRILELSMQIYPDGVYERRDYIDIYVPIFRVVSDLTLHAEIGINLTLTLNVDFKPEYSLWVNPYFSWVAYLDLGSLPARRIFYHNGYYWTLYVSKPEPITVEDMITGKPLGTITWSITPLFERDTWRYTGTRRLNVEISKIEVFTLQSTLTLETPSYVTVLRVRIPARILLKLDMMNADSTLIHLEQVKVYGLRYSISP